MSQDAEEENTEEEEVTVRHEYSDGYELVPATGVHGGYQPQGNFKIDFVVDHNEKVTEETFTFKDGEQVDASVELDSAIIREHLVGVTMEGKDVFSSACWMLGELLDEDPEHIQQTIAEEYELEASEGEDHD